MSLSIDIYKKYKNFTLAVNLENVEKQFGILGASGCGKSMTLKCIAGLEKPDNGRIILNDKVLFDSNQKINLTPQKRKIGYLFQNYALFPHMTVRENIGVTLNQLKEKNKIVQRMVNLFHLEDLEQKYPMQLSGGQQQRVALARILAYEPDVLLLDEPFSALDAYLKDQLQQEMLEILKNYKGEIIMVSHSREELYRFCNRLAVMNAGRMVAVNSTYNIFHNPGNVIAAKLTGCKNISKAFKLTNYEILAIDWNTKLITNQPVCDEISYVGIRAHDIQISCDENEENSLAVHFQGISEGPFENNLLFQISEEEPGENKICWKVSKTYWETILKHKIPNRIQLPREHLMLLKE